MLTYCVVWVFVTWFPTDAVRGYYPTKTSCENQRREVKSYCLPTSPCVEKRTVCKEKN